MGLLDNETHLHDAELMAGEQSKKFLNDALEIINERSPDDVANCKVVLASLVISQAVIFVGQYYINALISGLEDIAESIDCGAAKPVEFWMQSDLAAIDKANELGINIMPEYSITDLRYKIYRAIHEVV
jgi:hypothetical protein